MMVGLLSQYLGRGLIADRPVTPEVQPGILALYLATDEDQVYWWNSDATPDPAWELMQLGFTDAPVDGLIYARQDGQWVEVTAGGGGGIEEAPVDGTAYARQDAAWVSVPDTGLEDAPNDGEVYGRQNELWVPIESGGGATEGVPSGYVEFHSVTGVASTSAYAAKGNVIRARYDVVVVGADCWFGNLGGTYRLTIARTNAAGVIQEILDVGPEVVQGTDVYAYFPTTSPTLLLAGNYYAVMYVRVDGTAVSPANPSFPGSIADVKEGLFQYVGAIRYASIAPQVGDSTIYANNTATGMNFVLAFPADPTLETPSTPVIRGTSQLTGGNATSYNVPLPAGTQAGDLLVVFGGHAFVPDQIAGAFQIRREALSNWGTGVNSIIVTAAHIADGFVTQPVSGSSNGVFFAVAFVAGTAKSIAGEYFRFSNTSGGTTNQQVGPRGGKGIMNLLFASGRTPTTWTSTQGVVEQQAQSALGSGVLVSLPGDVVAGLGVQMTPAVGVSWLHTYCLSIRG